MEAIGIVRRIDILGRMVIPMEIRRLQGIRTGDSIEIFADNEGNGSY
ncbi:MAG: AbrB/MazE/SpoVT family DNA-binding domain-containing protein [Sedimentibacter sp.]